MKKIKNKFDQKALDNKIKVIIENKKLCISHLELQIAFKESVLKTPKDLDDASHVRDVAREYLDDNLIRKYKESLHEFY